jgi:peptide/nickel transport system substrate-binding protein
VRIRQRAAILLLAAAGGCSDRERQSAAVQVGVIGEVRGLKPGYALELSEGTAMGMVFESLAERDSMAKAIPALAKRWVSVDSQTWMITLESGVKFHDGSVMTAADVVRSWTTLVADSTDGDAPSSVFMLVQGAADVRAHRAAAISGLQVIDDTTLRIALVSRAPSLPEALGSRRLSVMAKGSAPWAPIGTGPWKFVSGSRGDSVIRYVRHELYRGGRAANESLLVRIVDQRAVAAVFAAGRIDCMADLTPRIAGTLVGSRAIKISSQRQSVRSRVLLNFANPALRDIRVRRALLLALDRRNLVLARGSAGINLSDSFVPDFSSPSDTVPLTPYNPDSARRLLAAAGYTDANPLRLRAPLPLGDSTLRSMNQVVSEYWLSIGVRISATGASGDDSPRTLPVSDVVVWSEEPALTNPEDYLSTVGVEPPFGYTDDGVQWRNATFLSLYQQARNSRDPRALSEARRKLIFLAADSLPSIPLYFEGSSEAQSGRVNACQTNMPRFATSRILRP